MKQRKEKKIKGRGVDSLQNSWAHKTKGEKEKENERKIGRRNKKKEIKKRKKMKGKKKRRKRKIRKKRRKTFVYLFFSC